MRVLRDNLCDGDRGGGQRMTGGGQEDRWLLCLPSSTAPRLHSSRSLLGATHLPPRPFTRCVWGQVLQQQEELIGRHTVYQGCP